jgi:hypothetical protein
MRTVYPLAARGWTLGWRAARDGSLQLEKSPPQFVLDLAVDALKLGGKIPH